MKFKRFPTSWKGDLEDELDKIAGEHGHPAHKKKKHRARRTLRWLRSLPCYVVGHRYVEVFAVNSKSCVRCQHTISGEEYWNEKLRD